MFQFFIAAMVARRSPPGDAATVHPVSHKANFALPAGLDPCLVTDVSMAAATW